MKPYPETENPRLFLALSGFSATQQAVIEEWLASEAAHHDVGQVLWVLKGQRYADAKILARPPKPAQVPQADAVKSTPTSALAAKTLWQDDAHEQSESQESAKNRFLNLLAELAEVQHHLCAAFVVAGQLIDRYLHNNEAKGLWHVQADGGTLLAVVDYDRLTLSVRQQTHFMAFTGSVWDHRSNLAKAPESFMTLGLERVLWDYTRRTERQLLPKRYEKELISLRRYPRMPLTSMYDVELAVLTSLRAKPCTFNELALDLGLSLDELRKILMSLFYAGAVSSHTQTLWNRIQQKMRPDAGPVFRQTQSTLMTTPSGMAGSSVQSSKPVIMLKNPPKKR